MNKLLEKAKNKDGARSTQKRSQDELELAIAWLRREVEFTQVAHAIDKANNPYAYTWLARTLREAFDAGLIQQNSPNPK